MFKYTLVTGATGGLGKAFAVACAEEKQNLILTDISADKLKVLAESLKARYQIDVMVIVCDLMDMDARELMFNQIDAVGADINRVINIAGLDFEGGIETMNTKKISRVMRVNTEAMLDITRYVSNAPHDGKFYIINVASMAGFYPMPLKALYSASKRAVIQFSLAIREEIRNKGGHMTVLCPAGLKTNTKVIEKIKSQGFMGEITTIEVGKVAARTLRKSRGGRAIYIPGIMNMILVAVSSLFSEIMRAKIVYRRWKGTQEKTSNSAIQQQGSIV